MSRGDSNRGFTGQKVQETGNYLCEGGAVQSYNVGDEFAPHPQSGKRVVWEKAGIEKKLGDAH
jgi:hypothetical protein